MVISARTMSGTPPGQVNTNGTEEWAGMRAMRLLLAARATPLLSNSTAAAVTFLASLRVLFTSVALKREPSALRFCCVVCSEGTLAGGTLYHTAGGTLL